MRGRRQVAGTILSGVGVAGLIVTTLLLIYPAWAEWQARLDQEPGPAEVLPERAEVLPEGVAGATTEPVPAPGQAEAEAATSTSIGQETPDGEPVLAATTPPVPRFAEADGPPDGQAKVSIAGLPDTGIPSVADASAEAEGQAEPQAAEDQAEPQAAEGQAEPEAEAASPEPQHAEAPPAPAAASSGYGRATWMTIPRIGVDSRVVEVSLLADGEFQAPAFSVGHHVSSPEPGQPGNSVFAGHLTSINAGRVFARLHELRTGDAIYVYSPGYRLDWSVAGVRTVPNTDSSFIQPTGETRLTLYTCAGQFLPLSADYSQRLVVTARLLRAMPRGS